MLQNHVEHQQDYSLAVEHHRDGRLALAEELYRKVIDAKPNHANALHNYGVLNAQQGNRRQAVELFERAITVKPNYPEAYNNMGNVLQESGKLDEALLAYDSAINLQPDYAEVHNSKGELLKRQGRFEEASECYRKTISLQANHYQAIFNLGLVLDALGRRPEALIQFQKTLEIRTEQNSRTPDHPLHSFTTRAKLQHDIEQCAYLVERGIDPDHYSNLALTYESIVKEIDWPVDEGQVISFTEKQRQQVRGQYNYPLNLGKGKALPVSTINPDLDTSNITNKYFENDPGVFYFDNLLTAKSLYALREYLLESTIWFDFSHVNGFLAAYLENGLACPVLFQIADDFRGRFPEILQDCVLCQCWAFKCISPGKTIDVHADAATVSLNFWITPNSANIESETGGMVVYRNETPPEWQLTGYDQDISAIRQFLSEQSDKKVEIPYNENRAVIFNSKLFHETSRPVFKPGYENHRINVTMLFGTG